MPRRMVIIEDPEKERWGAVADVDAEKFSIEGTEFKAQWIGELPGGRVWFIEDPSRVFQIVRVSTRPIENEGPRRRTMLDIFVKG